MGSEKTQLPAPWTPASLPPSLPILCHFPQLPSLFLPIFLPFLLPALRIPRRKGKQMGPSELQKHSFILEVGSVPFPDCYSTVGPRFVGAVLVPPGVQSWLQRQGRGLESFSCGVMRRK